MNKEQSNKPFNNLNRINYENDTRRLEAVVSNTNKILSKIIEQSLGDFLAFEDALLIMKEGARGLQPFKDKVIQEVVKRALLTSEKQSAREHYTRLLRGFDGMAEAIRKNTMSIYDIINLDIFLWNSECKRVELRDEYKDIIKPKYIVKIEAYHHEYLRLLDKYIAARMDLEHYHGLVFSYDYPTPAGIIRMPGHYTDKAMLIYEGKGRYKPISLDNLTQFNIHKPDDEKILENRL